MKLSPSLHHPNKFASSLSSPIRKPHVTPSSLLPQYSKSKVLTTNTTATSSHVKRISPPQCPPHSYSSKTRVRANDNRSVRLGRHWPDYHGARDWEGLLNPLDDNLRSEILRYGNFVEAAYRAFDFDPSSSSYATCRFRKKELLDGVGFSNTGYRLTKNLLATSSVQLPRWTGWAAIQSSWIGYVAVCTEKSEIQRLGRRDVVIALRGTATCLEWLENIQTALTPLRGAESESAMVESGFHSLYTSSTSTCQSLQDTLRCEVARILATYRGEDLSFTITGHSLGAALATIAAYDIKTVFKESAPSVTVMSFGGPRVGNRSFRCHVERQGTKVLRIVNSGDVVTRMPGFVVESDAIGEWFRRRVEDTQWGYAEVGSELRLIHAPPYNLARCHELKTYLSLVGSSVGTAECCPIRQTTRMDDSY